MKTIVYQVSIFYDGTSAEVIEYDNEAAARHFALDAQSKGYKVQACQLLRQYDGYNFLKFNDKLIKVIKL